MMRFVIQRVSQASVRTDGVILGEINTGFLVLIGIADTDTPEIADKMIHKLLNMRIFEDAQGKTNLGLREAGGNLLLISQFTLYADCRKGNRPSFLRAAGAAQGEVIYDYIVFRCREEFPGLQTGRFGADMKVSLVNDGPFTILLDSEQLRLS